jgi:hypothetical protein
MSACVRTHVSLFCRSFGSSLCRVQGRLLSGNSNLGKEDRQPFVHKRKSLRQRSSM